MGDIDLRLGRYQDVLQGIECDAIICDPPYSDRTHVGRRTGSEIRQGIIKYDPMTEADAIEFAQHWNEFVRWWVVIFCDHITRQWHESAWQSCGWYVFGPVRWVKPNAPPRMSGDGPCVSTEDILVARRSVRLPGERSGSRPGHYICTTETGGDIHKITGKTYPGGKPVLLMQRLISDYTVPGDMVVDPYAGMGTTLIAAHGLG